jgi:ATP-dependent RNA helicase RhlE
MAAAAKAARQEMMQRIGDNKSSQGAKPKARAQGDGEAGDAPRAPRQARGQAPQGEGRTGRNRRRGNGGNAVAQDRLPQDRLPGDEAQPGQAAEHGADRPPREDRGNRRSRSRHPYGQRSDAPRAQQPREREAATHDDDYDPDLERLPRHVDPLQTNLHTRRINGVRRPPAAGAQPDPMRTSIDAMGAGKRYGGGGGGKHFGGGGNGGGGGRGGRNRTRGGGGGGGGGSSNGGGNGWRSLNGR